MLQLYRTGWKNELYMGLLFKSDKTSIALELLTKTIYIGHINFLLVKLHSLLVYLKGSDS